MGESKRCKNFDDSMAVMERESHQGENQKTDQYLFIHYGSVVGSGYFGYQQGSSHCGSCFQHL
jgi:hypothetical protein